MAREMEREDRMRMEPAHVEARRLDHREVQRTLRERVEGRATPDVDNDMWQMFANLVHKVRTGSEVGGHGSALSIKCWIV